MPMLGLWSVTPCRVRMKSEALQTWQNGRKRFPIEIGNETGNRFDTIEGACPVRTICDRTPEKPVKLVFALRMSRQKRPQPIPAPSDWYRLDGLDAGECDCHKEILVSVGVIVWVKEVCKGFRFLGNHYSIWSGWRDLNPRPLVPQFFLLCFRKSVYVQKPYGCWVSCLTELG